jgi:predicted RNA-binding protein with TRAM domain
MYGNRSFGGGQRRGGFAPVKVGQELDVKIESVGGKGDGIAKEKGFVLFVPGTKQGDEVKIRVTKVLKNVGFAEVVTGGSSAEKAPEGNSQEESASEEAEDSSSEDEESKEDNTDEEEEETDSEDSDNFGEEEPKE